MWFHHLLPNGEGCILYHPKYYHRQIARNYAGAFETLIESLWDILSLEIGGSSASQVSDVPLLQFHHL